MYWGLEYEFTGTGQFIESVLADSNHGIRIKVALMKSNTSDFPKGYLFIHEWTFGQNLKKIPKKGSGEEERPGIIVPSALIVATMEP